MIYYDLLWLLIYILLIYISISIITFEFRLISRLCCFSSLLLLVMVSVMVQAFTSLHRREREHEG